MAEFDIVARLIGAASESYGCQCLKCEAAKEIERMRSEMLIYTEIMTRANQRIERLRAERDEARRQYCRGFTDFCPNPAFDHLSLEEAAVEVAKSFGWDCFKEEQ